MARLFCAVLLALCLPVGALADAGPDPADRLTIREGCELDQNGGWTGVTEENVLLTYEHLRTAEATQSPIQAGDDTIGAISLTFTEEGALLLAEATERLIGQQISIWIGEELLSAPYVHVPIRDGEAVITGSFGGEDAEALAARITATIPTDEAGAGASPGETDNPSTGSLSAGGPAPSRLAMTAGALGAVLFPHILFWRGRRGSARIFR